jgi:hypothetical protein
MNGTGLEATDIKVRILLLFFTAKQFWSKAMPKCLVEYENGGEWDEDNKSYSSYNIVYQAQNIRLDDGKPEYHPLEVKVGMGIDLRPAASGDLHSAFSTNSTQGFRGTSSTNIICKS